MFDDDLVEVESDDGIRYIMRRNHHIADQIERNRQERIAKLRQFIEKKNKYLNEHKRAGQDVARKKIYEKAEQLKVLSIVEIKDADREFTLEINRQQYAEKSKLDGCYVIKTDVSRKHLDKETAHRRYKDLSNVEFAFRTMKTTIEDIRPIFVRKENRTRGHVFIAMLGYMIIKYITEAIKGLDITRKHAIELLDKIQYITYKYDSKTINVKPHVLSEKQSEILSALDIKL